MRPRFSAGPVLACVLASLLLGGCRGGDGDSTSSPASPPEAQRFDEDRAFADLRAQVEIGPRAAGTPGSRREVRFIARRLRGAGVQDVRVQRPHLNVLGTIPGTGEGTIVVGAHHDTVAGIPGFVGANDGASGVAVLLELARSLPRPMPGPSVTLAFFDAEEARPGRPFEADGTRGSRQFIRLAETAAQGTPPLDSIRAMYLFDLVGDCDLQIPREANSDPELYERLDGPAFSGTTSGILDDHIPFRGAGIPAVDAIDFTYGPGPAPGAFWHTPQDTLDKVCPESLGQVGRAAIGALLG